MKKILISCISLLVLTGCVTQDQADEKMSKGCIAGVESLIEPKNLGEIKSMQYADEMTEGGMHRRVTITAVEKDGWVELEKEYTCLFMQEWGIFSSDHRALLVQIEIDEELYGKKDGKIIGDFDDFLALSRSVDAAMGQ